MLFQLNLIELYFSMADKILNESNQKYFNLYHNCFLETAKRNGAIYDIYKQEIYIIDLKIAKILRYSEKNKFTIQDIIKKLHYEKYTNKIISYLNELTRNDLGFFSNNYIVPLKLRPDETFENLSENYICWPLRKIFIELINECNLNCCQFFDKYIPLFRCSCKIRPKNKIRLSFEDWRKIIQDAYILGCKEVHFVGGEPLLLRDTLFGLISLIRKIMPNKTRILVHTNLCLIDEFVATFFKTNNIEIIFNIYSNNPQIHDLITGVNNSWKIMIENIKILLNFNVIMHPNLEVIKHNEKEISNVKNFIVTLGIKSPINLSIVLSKNKNIASKCINNIFYKSLIAPPNREMYFLNKESHPCWAGAVAITSDGNIIPCPMAQNEIIGNIFNNNLKNIVANKKMEKWWMCSKDKISLCKDCELRYACFDCRPAQSSDGTLYGAPIWCPKNIKLRNII